MAVEEKKKEQIKRQAKEILDKFSKALSCIPNVKESNVVRDEDRREERRGEGKECDSDFRQLMFKNAPRKNKDFIIAEKKKW